MSAETELDVLAVFSHPDDAELTMAGTLIKLKSLGYRTGVLDMTRGEMGTRGTPEIRAKESLDAARLMGLDARFNLEQPDGHITLDEETRLPAIKMPAMAHAVYSRLVTPTFIVDVSEFAEGKMNAIRAYASQFYSEQSKEPTTRISEQGFLDEIEV